MFSNKMEYVLQFVWILAFGTFFAILIKSLDLNKDGGWLLILCGLFVTASLISYFEGYTKGKEDA